MSEPSDLDQTATELSSPKKTSSLRKWRWPILAVFVGLIYGAILLAAGREIATGTRIAGQNVGGMSVFDAKYAVFQSVQKMNSTDVNFQFDGQTFTTKVKDLGLQVDYAATFNQLPIDSYNPFVLLAGLITGNDYQLVVTGGERLSMQIDSIVSPAEQAPLDATIRFEAGSPVVVPAKAGQLVDRGAAIADVLTAAGSGFQSNEIMLQLQTVQPTVLDDVARAYIDSTVRGLITDSVTVNVTGKPELVNVFSVEDIRTAMRFRTVGGQLEAYLQPGVLARRCNPDFIAQTQPVQDATWDVSTGVPVVVPSKSGFGVSNQALAAAVESVWRKPAGDRVAQVSFGELDPKLTTEAIKDLGVVELVSTFKQNFPAAAYRSQNIGQAAAYLNGTLLMPGDEFSMNNTIKERTEANGYTSGWIIGANGVFQYEPGGGVSTATTATFNAAFFAGMKFKEWRAHSIYISRYPAGREATVSWGSLDMRFVNNYDTAIFITTKMTSTSITVSFWGTKHWQRIESESGPWTNLTKSAVVYNESDQCHSQFPVPGFRITVYRVFYRDDVAVKREPFNSTYRSTPKVICGSASDSTATPKPTKTTKKPSPTPTQTPTPTESSSGSATSSP